MDREAHGAFEAGHRSRAAGRPRGEERPAVDPTGPQALEETGRIRRLHREDERRRADGEIAPALGNQVAQHLEQRSEVRPPPIRVGIVRQDGQEHGGARAGAAARCVPVDVLRMPGHTASEERRDGAPPCPRASRRRQAPDAIALRCGTLERSRRARDEHRAVRGPQHRRQAEDGGMSMAPDRTARRLRVKRVRGVLEQQKAVALAPVSPWLGVPGEPERVAQHDGARPGREQRREAEGLGRAGRRRAVDRLRSPRDASALSRALSVDGVASTSSPSCRPSIARASSQADRAPATTRACSSSSGKGSVSRGGRSNVDGRTGGSTVMPRRERWRIM